MAARSLLSFALLALLVVALPAPGTSQASDHVPPADPGAADPPGGGSIPVAAAAACLAPCGENQRCENGACVCEEAFVNISGICRQASTHLGEPCQYPRQCQKILGGYATCESGKCACSSVAVVANNTCVKKIGLDERCTFPEQCVLVENSACQPDVCLCRKGFVQWQQKNATCVPVVDTHRGFCNITTQCDQGRLGPGATCVSQQCRCMNQYYYDGSHSKCLYKKTLDEECNEGQTTGCYLEKDGDNQHIECKNGVCKCKKGYWPSYDRETCEGGAGHAQLSALAIVVMFAVYIMK